MSSHQTNTGSPVQTRVMAAIGLATLVLQSFAPAALAQGATPGAGGAGGFTTPTFDASAINAGRQSNVILPTDVLPLPTIQNRLSFGEGLQLRILQKLPSRFYANATCETSFRYETNPFQFPTKRKFLTQLPSPAQIRVLDFAQQREIMRLLGFVGTDQVVFRCLPNVTGGFTVTPTTRVFCNYFMIRDQLYRTPTLNTVIHSYSMGAQQDIRLGQRCNLQVEFQARELNQIHQQSVFDFLPGLTMSYIVTPRTVAFVNALLQMRGKKYFQAPTKELDPFYTWGLLHQRGSWSFSASTTLVQNFREPFRRNASIPVNNYAFISDFEISKRLIKQLPGLQGFIRAEPIWNFKSHNRPGLAGMDFRLFWGLRAAVAKPSLTQTLDILRKQLEEEETAPPPAPKEKARPSAYIDPAEVIASSPQPIHGFMSDENKIMATQDGSQTAPVAATETVMPRAEVVSSHEEEPAVSPAVYSEPVAKATVADSAAAAPEITAADSGEQKQSEPVGSSRKNHNNKKQAKVEPKEDLSFVIRPQAIQ